MDIEQVKLSERVSPVLWVEAAQIRLANGEVYGFADRPYLIQPLRSLARKKSLRRFRDRSVICCSGSAWTSSPAAE